MHDPRRGLQHSAAPGGGRGERTIALRGDPHADLRRAGDDHRPPGLPRWGAALACFVVLLAGGSLLLSMPGILKAGRISALDAVVLAASAVTLTGLSPVPVSELSQQGQVLLLVLFQGSGIAIIAFSILHLAVPGALHARSSQRIVRPRWIEVEQLRTGRLLRDIVLMTLLLEGAGALVLYPRLRALGVGNPAFSSVFLAASAFCNAGFVPGESVMTQVAVDRPVLLTIMVLASVGALGYVVLRDIVRRVAGPRKPLDLQTRIVLLATLVLVGAGAALVFSFRPRGAGGVLESLFDAVSARTAGFDLPGRARSPAADVLTMLLMLVGGAPGSVAGGLKITAVSLALLVALGGTRASRSGLSLAGRRVPPEASELAVRFVLRALVMLACAALLLAATETLFNHQARPSLGQVLFETTSAFTSTGLSSGLMPVLSGPGKAVLALTMLAGRFGLLAMVARASAGGGRREATSPLHRGEVVVG